MGSLVVMTVSLGDAAVVQGMEPQCGEAKVEVFWVSVSSRDTE